MSTSREELKPCQYCGKPPGTKVGPPALARCVTPECEGTKLAAYTFEKWNALAATPKAGVDTSPRFNHIMKHLTVWRNADHEDNLTLCRSDIIEIIEGVKALTLPSVLGGVDQKSSADGPQCNEQSGKQLSPAWRDVADRPEIDSQPSRQFVVVEGSSFHSGVSWHRMHMGVAYIRKPGTGYEMLQYRESDILAICKDGDIDPHTARVTYWMPAIFPTHPDAQTGAPPPDNAGLVSGGGR